MKPSLSSHPKLLPVVECFIVKEDKLLLFKRSSTAKNFPNYWVGPGGHIDPNEDPLTAAIREVREETGIELNEEDVSLKYILSNHHLDRKEIYLVFGFRINLKSSQSPSPSSEGTAAWIPLRDLPHLENLFPPTKAALTYGLRDKPGIYYSSAQLRNFLPVKVTTSRFDRNF